MEPMVLPYKRMDAAETDRITTVLREGKKLVLADYGMDDGDVLWEIWPKKNGGWRLMFVYNDGSGDVAPMDNFPTVDTVLFWLTTNLNPSMPYDWKAE